jgi:hypothetical protein
VSRTNAFSDISIVAPKYKKADLESLIQLNAALKNQVLETKRREVTYEQVLEQAFFLEDILKNSEEPH